MAVVGHVAIRHEVGRGGAVERADVAGRLDHREAALQLVRRARARAVVGRRPGARDGERQGAGDTRNNRGTEHGHPQETTHAGTLVGRLCRLKGIRPKLGTAVP